MSASSSPEKRKKVKKKKKKKTKNKQKRMKSLNPVDISKLKDVKVLPIAPTEDGKLIKIIAFTVKP